MSAHGESQRKMCDLKGRDVSTLGCNETILSVLGAITGLKVR